MTRYLWLIGWCFCLFSLHAAEIIPPAPKAYFNDYAGVVPANDASALNQRLEDFEKATSNQVVVAVFQKMQSDSSIEDYTVRVAQKWGIGQKGKNNGVVLFVFIKDRKMYIQVGYGLEGALPDATAKLIIENEIKPHFKQGDYAGGLRTGVNAVLAATKGEYKGTGQIAGQNEDNNLIIVIGLVLCGIIILYCMGWLNYKVGGSVFSSRGLYAGGGDYDGGGGFFGGFSGGGGGFGGGGAGGGW